MASVFTFTTTSLFIRFGSKKGINPSDRTIFVIFRNPLIIFVYLSQVVVHWLFGIAISITFDNGFSVEAGNLFDVAFAVLLLMVITRFCNNWQPKGPLPATYGHIQTIVNLVDVLVGG
jgi:hypothetical protein